jgi:hypothetical protein
MNSNCVSNYTIFAQGIFKVVVKTCNPAALENQLRTFRNNFVMGISEDPQAIPILT